MHASRSRGRPVGAMPTMAAAAPRRGLVAIASFCLGCLITLSISQVPASRTVGASSAVTRRSTRTAEHDGASSGWDLLRPTACDGPSMGGVQTQIPASASIGNFQNRPVQLLRTLGDRSGLAYLANSLNLTGRAAELGVWRGEFAEANLKVWRGAMYVLVDLWTSADTDCVNGNSSTCVYGGNASRSFDRMMTGLRMQRGGPRFKGRYEFVQKSTTEAASLYPDEYFDWIYLDATHTYAEARRDLAAWYPKVRVGGLVSGHDYQFQHQEIGDGYTFGVKDAVDEFASRRHLRVHSTCEPYLPSFYFLKCTRR